MEVPDVGSLGQPRHFAPIGLGILGRDQDGVPFDDHAAPVSIRADRVFEGEVDHRAPSFSCSRESVALSAASPSILRILHMILSQFQQLLLP